jgi:hypothetical protein
LSFGVGVGCWLMMVMMVLMVVIVPCGFFDPVGVFRLVFRLLNLLTLAHSLCDYLVCMALLWLYFVDP